jgi:hypothetical protein
MRDQTQFWLAAILSASTGACGSGGGDESHGTSGLGGSGTSSSSGGVTATGGVASKTGGNSSGGNAAGHGNAGGGGTSPTGGTTATGGMGGSSTGGGAGASSSTGGTTATGGAGGSGTGGVAGSASPSGGAGVSSSTGGATGTGGMAGTTGGSSTGGGLSAQRGALPADAGGSDAAEAGPPQDPCQGVTPFGECIAGNQYRVCVIPTGDGQPTLKTVACTASEQCSYVGTQALCAPIPNRCNPGAQECVSPTSIRTCGADGTWTESACATACHGSALGAFCADTATTTGYTLTIQYEARGPNSDITDWSPTTVVRPAADVLVVGYRGNTIIDAQTTDASGRVTVQIPAVPQADDRVLGFLMRPSTDGKSYVLAVAQPDLPDGVSSYKSAPGTNPSWWTWSIDPRTNPSGSTLLITEALGSGAVRLYDYLRHSYAFANAQYGGTGKTLVAWLRMNTSWDCGSCFAPSTTVVSGLSFDASMFISANATDRTYWSDPVTAHEFGHWVMASYGYSPNEGGRHCLAVPTFPGQAWSEGWATAFSSFVRNDSVYYDKQSGAMFWFDLALRHYSGTRVWQRPVASDGLFQRMDENDVAAMVWQLALDPAVGRSSVLSALTTRRLTAPPFGRGYTRRSWDQSCPPLEYNPTTESVPMFADYLDSLVCQGAPATAIDNATNPTQCYPYPSNAPICS